MIESFRQHNHPLASDEILPAGTPLVALKNARDFFEHGLMERDGLLFGMMAEDGGFLYSATEYEDQQGIRVRAVVRQCPMSELQGKGYAFYVPEGGLFQTAPASVISRARSAVQERRGHRRDFSPVGDDFLYGCLTGNPMQEYMRSNPDVGKHVRVDFSVRELLAHFEFARKRLETGGDSQKAAKVQALLNFLQGLTELHDLKLSNCAICLGGDTVSNFSVYEQGDDRKCELRMVGKERFAKDGDVSTISYPSRAWFGDARKRLRARNVALHLLMQRPEFSLRNYNSEHFCYTCSKGKAKSPQKRALLFKPVKMFLPGLSWLNPFKKIYTIYKTVVYLVKLGALLRSFKQESRG